MLYTQVGRTHVSGLYCTRSVQVRADVAWWQAAAKSIAAVRNREFIALGRSVECLSDIVTYYDWTRLISLLLQ